MTTSRFDSALTELNLINHGCLIDVYKVGGGTLGKSYEGRWGYRILRQGTVIAAGEDYHTGMPKTHREVAAAVMEIHKPYGANA